jgi:hypothetical protein
VSVRHDSDEHPVAASECSLPYSMVVARQHRVLTLLNAIMKLCRVDDFCAEIV